LPAYDPSEWTDLGVAAAGASAALAGLVFVAVSINIDRILAFPWLPARAAETVILLVAVMVESLLVLAPGQSHVALGLELLLVAGIAWLLVTSAHVRLRAHRDRITTLQRSTRIALGQAATLPAIVAGATLLAEAGGGLYWLLVAFVLALVAALLNAWVLLIEIVR
jgi:hypothetical protein